MPESVIVDAVRTPIGRAFKGSLAQMRPDEMGAFVVDALLERNQEVDPELIEEVYCGVGLPQGLQGFNMGRIIALLSERLPLDTNGATVSRYCASSLESIRQASNAIAAGQGHAYIAAGVEWVSRYNEAVEGARPQDQNEKLQGGNGRPDAYISMGLTAENVAERYEVSRADMDKYAQRSQELAVQSQESGYYDREIVPVTLPDGKVVSKDDGPRASSTLEKLSQLDPAFKEDGKVTAGNSCPLNDGAAAVLVMSATKADELGLKPRARGWRPSSAARGSLITTTAAAPSFNGHEFPAVTFPPGLKTGSSSASFSSVDPRRGPSSAATPSQGVISRAKKPLSWARTARSCERCA